MTNTCYKCGAPAPADRETCDRHFVETMRRILELREQWRRELSTAERGAVPRP